MAQIFTLPLNVLNAGLLNDIAQKYNTPEIKLMVIYSKEAIAP